MYLTQAIISITMLHFYCKFTVFAKMKPKRIETLKLDLI